MKKKQKKQDRLSKLERKFERDRTLKLVFLYAGLTLFIMFTMGSINHLIAEDYRQIEGFEEKLTELKENTNYSDTRGAQKTGYILLGICLTQFVFFSIVWIGELYEDSNLRKSIERRSK